MVPVVQDFLVNAERITGVGQEEIRKLLRDKCGVFNESKASEYIRVINEHKTRKVQEMVEKRFVNNPHCPYHPEAITYGSMRVSTKPNTLAHLGELPPGWTPGWECQVGGTGCYWKWKGEQTVQALGLEHFQKVKAERQLLQELVEE
jgi:hypothetical protein